MTGFVEAMILVDIEQRCLAAVLEGGETWAQFKTDAEARMGLPWSAVKSLLDERYAKGGGVSVHEPWFADSGVQA